MTPSGSSQACREHTARLLLQSFSRGKAAEVIRPGYSGQRAQGEGQFADCKGRGSRETSGVLVALLFLDPSAGCVLSYMHTVLQ